MLPSAQQAPARLRLYLTNGSYQLVLSYKITGKLVVYRSAERNGESEEIPLELVDLIRTRQWQNDHDPNQARDPAQDSGDRAPVLSPQLAREEAARAARTPTVAPNLKLPAEDSVLVLDTFEGTPELIPLAQQGSDLNKETAHAVLKGPINPSSGPHRILDLKGQVAEVQLHVDDPVFFVRLGKDDEPADTGGAFVVDTYGAADRPVPSGSALTSGYILERVEPRQDERVVDSFRIALLETGRKQPDIIELDAQPMPGGRWLRLTPKQRLEFGEYALIEVLDDRNVNLNVWDFGVHSDARENLEAIRPELPRSSTLGRH
ncbi:hypothetical protein [Bryocella elongata]|nr:hypothetical protein [Bryocella elongata]